MTLDSTGVLLFLCLLIAPVFDCQPTEVEDDNHLYSDRDASHNQAEDNDEEGEILGENACESQYTPSKQDTIRPTSATVSSRSVVCGPTAADVGPFAYEFAGQADHGTQDVHTVPVADTVCVDGNECNSMYASSQILGARRSDKLNESMQETPDGTNEYVQLLPMAEEHTSSAQRVEEVALAQASLSCNHTSCDKSPHQFTKGLLTPKQFPFQTNDSLVDLMLMKFSSARFSLTSNNSCHQDLGMLRSAEINFPFPRNSDLTASLVSREYPIPYKPASSLWYTLGVDVVILILLLLCLSKECTQKTNEAYLRFLVSSFFNNPTISKNDKSAKCNDSCKQRQEKSHSKSVPLGILSDIILQPWTIHIPSHAFARVKTSNACRWSDDTLCEACQGQLDRHSSRTSNGNDHVTGCLSRRAGQSDVEVRPVLRFLPDTTSNPDLDLAHVGYRLATLSALPSAVPVSRVKLADAGFYYRGQGDEVTCYACRGRHSGWTNDDKPWDVHRRISPNCPHVLEAPGGSVGCTATTGVSAPPVSAPRQNPQSAPPTGSMQATPHEVAGQSSQLVTSHGSSEEAARSLTSPRIPNAVANNPRHTMNGHSEAHFEDGDLINPTSLNTTTLTPALARTEAVTVAGQEQVGPSPLSGAQETMPPVYFKSQVFTSSVQSSATNNPHSTIQSGPGRTEAANIPAGTSRTGSSGGSNVPGAEVGSRNVFDTISAESANRSQAGPAGASNAPGEVASARYMFPRAGLELGGAVYPMYQDMASRRRSFPRWDETHAPSLDQIILCGMFYAGYADCVRCFYCGVGLKHWELTDDVWTEHVRWRSSCGYLRTVKGDDFIRRIQARLAREASGDDDNDEGPGDGNDRRPGPPGPPTPQEHPGTTSQERESRGVSRSGSGSSALTPPSSYGQHGDARSAPPSVITATSPQPAATSDIPSQTTITTATTVTAPSTVSTPTSAAVAASPPESSNNQPSTRPEGGSSIKVVEGETRSQRVARLQAENAELARRLRCKVCHREPIDTIIMPCGHLVVCENCARNTTQCPLCYGRIRATAKVHMS